MIYYREAEQKDMENVAALHKQCFSEYFLTKLGTGLLSKYYGEYLSQEQPFVLAFDDEKKENGGIIGLCLCYYKGCDARAQFESKNKGALSKRLLKLCLKFDKDAITRCWAKIMPKKKSPEGEERKIMDVDLLSICVDADYRGKGVSSELVDRITELSKQKAKSPISKMILYVNSDNDAARKFYEKKGFTVFGSGETQTIYIKNI